MRDPLDRVQIQLASRRDPLEISWVARTELVRRLEQQFDGTSAANVFREVGTSRAATFTTDEKEQLVRAIDSWIDDEGPELLPVDLLELRSALSDDLFNAGRGQ